MLIIMLPTSVWPDWVRAALVPARLADTGGGVRGGGRGAAQPRHHRTRGRQGQAVAVPARRPRPRHRPGHRAVLRHGGLHQRHRQRPGRGGLAALQEGRLLRPLHRRPQVHHYLNTISVYSQMLRVCPRQVRDQDRGAVPQQRAAGGGRHGGPAADLPPRHQEGVRHPRHRGQALDR